MSSDDVKNQTKSKRSKEFFDRLIYGKGTVAEPWPTVEEILRKPEVQDEIQKVQKAFNTYQSKTKNK